MKRLLGIALAAVLAGCATAPVAENASPEPELPQLTDPNPFANYSKGMASDNTHPMAYEWQSAHDAEITEATKGKALCEILDCDIKVSELLGKVKGAYDTDPMVATQIASISQIVMCQKCPKMSSRRVTWTTALLFAAKSSTDAYRAIYFLDQLRWCGLPDDADAVLEVGKKFRGSSADRRRVRDFADMVVRELKATK